MGAAIKRVTCIIEDGPNREILFDALRYAYKKEIIIPINFIILEEDSTEDDYRILKTKNVKIRGIDYDGENDTGHAFVIRGKMDVNLYSEPLCCDGIRSDFKTRMFEACYDTQTHRGRITFILY